jgi:hypothetical protein
MEVCFGSTIPAFSRHVTIYICQQYTCVGFEFLAAVIVKISIFWDITLCTSLETNRRHGGTHHLHLQVRTACYLLHAGFFLA